MAKSKMKPFGARTRYVLRTCSADLKAYGGFQWPAEGPVECPDWSAEPVCGQGLEGISSATLAKRLKRMMDIGLLTVSKDQTHSQKKLYYLTESAIQFIPIIFKERLINARCDAVFVL